MSEKKILLVDDEPELLELTKTRLEANGYEVITAQDGLEGLKKAKDEDPDLILLDIKMPKMDGYTMLKELQRDRGTTAIPVIMLTAFDRMKDLFELEGVTDYIVKPFDSQDLLLRVSRALRK